MRMGSVPTTMVPKPLYRPKKPRVLRMSRTIATPDEPRPLPSTICRVFNFNFILPKDFPNLTRALVLLLDHAHKVRGKRIVLVLDGADQLDSEYHGDMLHWLPYRAYARIVISMHTQSGSYDAMYRRYKNHKTNHLREMKVDSLPQQACRELLSERMFKAHKALSVRC